MGTGKTRTLPARLESVQRRFEHWRRIRKIPSRIPESLWAAAVRAAGRHGIHRTCRVLRVDYYSLKERVERSTSASDPAKEVTAVPFLELAPSAFPGPCECTLELEDAAGAKMRVHLKGVATPDLPALSRSFWNPAS